MSGVIKSFSRGSKKIAGAFGSLLGLDSPKMPEQPQVPQIDDANKNLNEADRIRKRRGVLANIFAGSSTGGTVGTKQLLGD